MYSVFGFTKRFFLSCSIFLKELENYEQLPEDVGHCFVTWVSHSLVFFSLHLFIKQKSLILYVSLSQADKFHMYVTYCRNKPDSSLLIQQHGVGFFEVKASLFKYHLWKKNPTKVFLKGTQQNFEKAIFSK